MTNTERAVPALIDCETAARALYDYLDGRLPAASERTVEAHVATCKACAPHFVFARRVLDLVPMSMPLSAESPALRARIVTALEADGYSGR